jgi:hypothetical protein
MAMRYLKQFPRKLPTDGRVLVHNHVRVQAEDHGLGVNGFRAWTQRLDDGPPLTRCSCGWSGLKHYHVWGRPQRHSVKGIRALNLDPDNDVRFWAEQDAWEGEEKRRQPRP